VNKLGKIFDALEKSKVKDSASVGANKTLDAALNGRVEDQGGAFDIADSLKKHNASASISYKSTGKSERSRRKSHVIPFDETEVLYRSNNIDKNLVAFLKPQSFEAEQFKMLRTNLFFPASGNAPRSIMVTSVFPGEGKSFVTANLAISIAQSIQEHVLVIDCDIRRPCMHTRFGFGEVPGLSEHLSDDIPLSSLILKTKINKLSILPGGKPPYNPSELLSSQQMSKLLEEVKERYSDRCIVIDSPPPKLTAETSVISRQVDGVLLVVEYGTTPRQMVSELIDIMGKEKVLGIILNKMDIRFSSYYGMGKYKKYGKYYAT
jgi:protein-tyrosine kinase